MPQANVFQNSVPTRGEGGFTSPVSSRMGMQVMCDFYTYAVLLGSAYQIRAGTITTPIVGSNLIQDAKAEMGIGPATGLTVMPVSCNITYRLAAATAFETAGKSVADATLSGGAFVPLPLKLGGPAAGCPAHVAGTAGVTVAAETVATTRRHFAWSAPIAFGTMRAVYDWNPTAPPIVKGPGCFYVQVAANTTGPSYFADLFFLEFDTSELL